MIGRIYRIQHNTSNLCYIGSTLDKLSNRWASHKSGYNAWLKCEGGKLNFSIYKHIKNHGGIKNFSVIQVKEYDVVDKHHLYAYEALWINRFRKSCVNEKTSLCLGGDIKKQRKKEYRMANRDKINQKHKEYYKKNKERIIQKREDKRINCDCGMKVLAHNFETHKTTKLHKKLLEGGKVAKNPKEYYEMNKEDLKTKIECECGGRYSKLSKSTHFKSKKHCRWMEQQTN